MSDKGSPPALTDAKGLGGIIAQDGFDYQLGDGLARVPQWLANPAFEQMIFEGLEDLEARFFAPHAPPSFRLLERYQAKSGNLVPGDVKAVFQSFHKFETSFEHAARLQTLVTPRLPPTVSWLARDPTRVRRARPFYAPFRDIVGASEAHLLAQLVKSYGDDLGPFIAQSVEIHERVLPDLASALQAFSFSLYDAFPTLDAGARRIKAAFDALSTLARRSVGAPLTRDALREAIESGLGEPLPLPPVLPLLVRSDRSETDETALEIDASAFSGGGRGFPGSTVWLERLCEPLDQTARWLRGRGISRVRVLGSYRLSTGIVVGAALRSAVGFELDIATRAGDWSTDDRPGDGDTLPWDVSAPAALRGGALVVSVGVLRDPAAAVIETLGLAPDSLLHLHLPLPITNGRQAQAGVAAVKRAVDEAVTRMRPRSIDMYLAAPAAFAVALGHRWNAMPPTQLHEFIAKETRYVETARI